MLDPTPLTIYIVSSANFRGNLEIMASILKGVADKNSNLKRKGP